MALNVAESLTLPGFDSRKKLPQAAKKRGKSSLLQISISVCVTRFRYMNIHVHILISIFFIEMTKGTIYPIL